MAIGGRLGVILLMLTLATAGMAQQGTSTSASRTNGITLDVVVTPKHDGSPVAGLSAKDFKVLDNGASVKIASFHSAGGADAPIKVILVVDAANANYQAVSYERAQIDSLLRSSGGHLSYPTQLAIVTDTTTQIQNGFSRDGKALSKALDGFDVGLRSIRRGTGFYGAGERLGLSIHALQRLTEHEVRLPGRKLVLWISPGWPILSGPAVRIGPKQRRNLFDTIVGMSTGLRKARITLYSIDPLGLTDAGSFYISAYQSFVKGVRKPDEAQFGNLALQVLAVETGGQVLNSSNDMTALLRKAMADTDAYYELSFDQAAGEPDEYHRIQIEMEKPGLVARTRTGYYSQ